DDCRCGARCLACAYRASKGVGESPGRDCVTGCPTRGLNSARGSTPCATVRPRMSTTTNRPVSTAIELGPEKLRWRCDLTRIPFETTAQAQKREGFVGQDRALRALKMGVELSAPGYNIFVCGLAGTSRGGTIAQMIEELHPATKPSLDRCYVNNFKLLDRPRLLVLPRGSAETFKKDMHAESHFLHRRNPQFFERDPFPPPKGPSGVRFSVRAK